MWENMGYDVRFDISADQPKGQLSSMGIIVNTEEAGVTVEGSEDL